MIASRLSKLSPRERTGLIAALLLVLCVVSDRVIIQSVRDQFGQQARDIALEQKRIEANMRALSPRRTAAIRAAYGKYAQYMKKRSSASEEGAQMLGEIETLGSRSKVSLIGTKSKEPKPFDYYEEYQVEVEVEGDMTGFVRFMYDLEQSPQLLTVQRIALSPKSKEAPSVVKGVLLISKVVAL